MTYAAISANCVTLTALGFEFLICPVKFVVTFGNSALEYGALEIEIEEHRYRFNCYGFFSKHDKILLYSSFDHFL